MSAVRPLERGDLPQVASLFERVMRSGSPVPSPGLAPYLERTILDHPWADPEIPSLVSIDDRGRIEGFIGSQVRRLRFDGRPVRMACGAHLIAAPEARNRAVGMFLARRYMGGAQDLTITDTSGEETRRMWAGAGGETASLSSINWIRVFRPCLLGAALGELRRGTPLAASVRRLCSALDAPIVRLAGRYLGTEPPRASAEALTAEALLAALPAITGPLRLYPDYDQGYLDFLFRELTQSGHAGSPVKSLVRQGERVLGWYVYFLRPGGVSRVLQVVSRERDVGPVLDHLFHHAQSNGSAALEGRVEPRLLESLSERRCILYYTGRALLHSRHPEILGAALSRKALLTRMDGEWWAIPA